MICTQSRNVWKLERCDFRWKKIFFRIFFSFYLQNLYFYRGLFNTRTTSCSTAFYYHIYFKCFFLFVTLKTLNILSLNLNNKVQIIDELC